jgi:hypothetical protein
VDKITLDALQTTVLVILAIAGGVVTIGKAIDTVKGWRKPRSDFRTELDTHAKHLRADKTRLEAHEEELAVLRDGLRVTCGGVQVLIDHELHNGNSTEMVEASKAINTWLLNK